MNRWNSSDGSLTRQVDGYQFGVRALGFQILGLLAVVIAAPAYSDPVLEAMQDYSEFATYDAGIILPEQITQEIFQSVVFIDTRSADEFAENTISGAMHIEWRDVFGRIDDIPTGQKVILFCNTGALSAQAAFGLRVAGHENILVLQTGYHGWLANAAYQPEG